MNEFITSLFSAFSLVFLAEIGDKSQLVCMTLAARYRSAPVMAGAVVAFLLLNTLAVVFGAGLALWIPETLVSIAVAILFAFFGIKSLLYKDENDEEPTSATVALSRSIFISTLIMLVFAEMGDKTQIAIAGLAVTLNMSAVWLGATLALMTTSALGIWLGAKLLVKMPLRRLHQLSGGLFLAIAVYAAVQVFRAIY